MHLSLIPLLSFTLAFIAGILLQGCGMGVLFMLAPFALAMLFLFLRRTYPAILCLSLCLGFIISHANRPQDLPESLTTASNRYSGIVTEVRRLEPHQVVVVKVDSCRGIYVRPFSVKITIPSSIPHIDETRRINFSAAFAPLIHDPDLPDEIDYDATARRLGVIGRAFVSPDSLTLLNHEPGLFNAIRRQRENVTLLIARSALGDDAKEFLNTALTGDSSMLPADTRELFAATGLAHILALSGLHVGILTLIISLMLMPLCLVGASRTRSWIIIISLWSFAIMTGLTASVVRAVIMATVFILSAMLQRVRAPFNSLCLAALLILLFQPSAIYTIGFQLSFFAVAAILLFAEKLNPVPHHRHVARMAASYPAVTLAAVLGTGIISAYYFHIFPLYFIPVNLISALLLPFILGGGVMLLLANLAGFQCLWLATCIDRLYEFILATANLMVDMPGAVAENIIIPPLTLAVWMLTLAAFTLWLYKRRAAYLTASLMLLAFTLFTGFVSAGASSPGAEVYVPRTSRNTSVLIRHNNTLDIATTAHRHELREIIDSHTAKYKLYMMKRGIDSIRPLPGHCSSSIFRRDSNLFCFNTPSHSGSSQTTLLLIHNKSQVYDDYGDRHIDYAVICNGFRGDILDVASVINPDTIILSADINRRRHDRYIRELSEAAIPHRTLRTSHLRIPIKSSRSK